MIVASIRIPPPSAVAKILASVPGWALKATNATPRISAAVRCAREVEEVRALGRVELQRTRERLENLVGDAAGVAALEPRVIVDADPGEERGLLAPESRNASGPAERGQTCLLRRKLRAPRGQELTHLFLRVHGTSVTRFRAS
jgi:hypothetical protein